MPKKLYVGNMNFATTENGLREIFSQYGEVVSVAIITDRATGRAKGFGFIEMADDNAAHAAISALDGKEFEGRQLKVSEAMDRPRESGGGGGGYRSDRY